MGEKLRIEPREVFDFFEKIASIPHGSFNTKEISDYLVSFAKERGLEYFQDEANNVIINKPATSGYEKSEPIMIQGHIDMVCEQVPGSGIDMTKDALELYVDGDMLRAKDTTLGGDDGIAVAMALAVLDSDKYKHPELNCIFTSDEEVGLIGAFAIDVSNIRARKMINIDSEEEGVITVSCAGGVSAKAIIPIVREDAEGLGVNLTIDGLLGGHSGIEIIKEHGNANVLMGRVLYELLKEVNYKLISVDGGNKDNAICKKTDAKILISKADENKLIKEVERIEARIAHELKTVDPSFTIKCESSDIAKAKVYSNQSLKKLITWLMNTPYGVQNMSKEIEGLVETSLNLGSLKTLEDSFTALHSIRSSVNTRKESICDKLDNLAEMLGGKIEYSGAYPGWEYRTDSPLRDTCIKVYKEQYGEEPRVEAIHAGLECGLFAGKMNDGKFDAVSIGPDMKGVHTTDESLSIPSVGRTWKYLLGILKASK